MHFECNQFLSMYSSRYGIANDATQHQYLTCNDSFALFYDLFAADLGIAAEPTERIGSSTKGDFFEAVCETVRRACPATASRMAGRWFAFLAQYQLQLQDLRGSGCPRRRAALARQCAASIRLVEIIRPASSAVASLGPLPALAASASSPVDSCHPSPRPSCSYSSSSIVPGPVHDGQPALGTLLTLSVPAPSRAPSGAAQLATVTIATASLVSLQRHAGGLQLVLTPSPAYRRVR